MPDQTPPFNPFDDDDDEPGYCDRCCNTGEVDCYCGGDLCICNERRNRMSEPVEIYLPDAEHAKRRGWKFHIQWSDNGRPCFCRRCTYAEAKRDFDKLTSEGYMPFVVDPSTGEAIKMGETE